MAQLLADIPDGVTCFIDATIFYYQLVNTPPLSDDCLDLLARAGTGAISGVTSTVALAEATHKVMEKLAVNYLATNNDDFDSIPGLIVCKPTRK